MCDKHKKHLFSTITNLDQYSLLTDNDKDLVNDFCQDLLTNQVQSFSIVWFSGPPQSGQDVKFAVSDAGDFLQMLGALTILTDEFKAKYFEDFFGEQ